jgi:hypothetical protein
MVSSDHELSQRRQCVLLRLSRSSLSCQPLGESAENLKFMEIFDKRFLEIPWYGSRQMARFVQRNNHRCGRHSVRRLMRLLRLVPISQEAAYAFDIQTTAEMKNMAWLINGNTLYSVNLEPGAATETGVIEGIDGMIRDVAILPIK